MSDPTDSSFSDPYLCGKLLIATPSIGDPRFDRTVILMCDHSEDHAMGIVVNKPAPGLRLPDLYMQLDIETERKAPDRAVLVGGPVERDRGFVLHSAEYEVIGATLPVTDTISMTATRDALEAIASAEPPKRFVLALGYAGWGAGQLEDEIAANAWLVVEPHEALVFGDANDDKWNEALARIGVTPEHLSAMSGRA